MRALLFLSLTAAIYGGTTFSHTTGLFTETTQGRWEERNGRDVFRFVETGSNKEWIYLRDDSRDMTIRLPRLGGWSAWKTGAADGGGQWTNLYPEVAPSDGYSHDNGAFIRQEDRLWVEESGRSKFKFAEARVTDNWIYLRDDSRDLNVRIPRKGGMSDSQEGRLRLESGWSPLYTLRLMKP